MKTVLHTIHTGGAETMLAQLIAADLDLRPVVISLLGWRGATGWIRAQNISARSLGRRKSVPSPVAFARWIRETPRLAPGWMHHGEVAATCSSRAKPRRAVVWNIGQSVPAPAQEEPLTRAVLRLGALYERVLYRQARSPEPDGIATATQGGTG